MEETKNSPLAVPAQDAGIQPITNPVQQPYPQIIYFEMKDGSQKPITRTERHVGKGGQGNVYYATDAEGQQYVIKIFDLSM